MFGFLGKAITGFLVIVAIGRLGGVESVGDYSFVVVFVSLFVFIAQMGIPNLLIREVARRRDDPEAVSHLVGNAISVCAFMGPLAIVLMAMVVQLMGHSGPIFYAVVLAGIALSLESVSSTIQGAFMAYEKMEWSSTIDVAQHLSFLLGGVIVLVIGYSLTWLFVAYVFSRVLALILATALYRRYIGAPAFGRDLRAWYAILRLGFPFAANTALSLVYIRLDVVLLSVLSGNLAVGFYEAATSLVIHINVIARSVNFSLLPELSREFVRDPRRVSALTARSIRYLAIPGFLITALLVVLGDRILVLIFGDQFLQSTTAVRLLAVIIPLRFIDHSLATALTAVDRQGLRSIGIAVAAALNLVLNLLLIPPYGFMGAVYATIVTELGLLICFVCFSGKDRWVMLNLRGLAGPLLGALVAGGITLFLRSTNASLFVLLTLCFLLYSGILWIVDKEVSRDVMLLFGRQQ